MNTFRTLFASAVLTLSFAAAVTAQENRPARRLEAVTWNPAEHKLTWTVVEGSLAEGGKFEGGKKTTFTIKMDEALMSLEGEDRRFSKTEAVSVHRLMDMVAKYAAESTVWWEAGEGEPVQKGGSRVDRRKDDPGAGDIERLVPRRKSPSEDQKKSKVLRISLDEEDSAPVQSQTIE